ncbi:MAG: excinuclease ABC subunit UvrA [Gemmatimonadaceae bacterium]|jgi:excinuclease ABC subunit A|nr:excinuclease ABC subunit UvrA [Gemmatimonadaceae bacterium]
MRAISIRGARQHNLRGVDVDIPHRALTVITGPSGSGKSSLAFDTLYAEGQRRYVESLSAYARQFLERMEKPLVDHIDGIAPAIAIEQKNPTTTTRSTVGTATEVYDYLRLLWARVGHTICPVCGRRLAPDSPSGVADELRALPADTRFAIAFPLLRSPAVSSAVIAENLRAAGFLRVAIGGTTFHLDDAPARDLDLAAAQEVLVVVDRLDATAATARLAEALERCFREGDGDAVVLFTAPTTLADGRTVDRWRVTERFQCPDDGHRAPVPTPQLFSFNNPRGACATCNGFGATLEYDLSLIVPDPARSLRGGAIDPWTKPRYEGQRRTLADYARKHGIPLDAPWRTLTAAQQERLLRHRERGWKGIFPFLVDLEEKRYKQYIRVFLRQYQTAQPCTTCGGTRLVREALDVRIDGRTIAQVAALPVGALASWLDTLALSPFEQTVAETVLREARARVRFLVDVGLGYLSLDRQTRTLSGGEAQRIGLANSLGAALVDALYVLDEPSIGLHPRDMDRLLGLLTRLRDVGNTVVMVEHDPDAIRIADYMIEMGPAAGEHGGRVVFAGPMTDAAASPLTGQYLTGARTIPLPVERRAVGPRWLELIGATEHNLHDISVRIPLGALTVVTGVSGSGKSTLMHDVLYRALESALHGESTAKQHLGERLGAHRALLGVEGLDDVVLVDQSPIGRSPRSNPVTYIKAYDELRKLFAEQPIAKQRGYTAGTFSFNVAGGRCETCEGAGAIEVEMVFMADVFVPCETCGGTRFQRDVLDVTVRGRNIHQVLQLSVDEAIRAFPREDRLAQALWQVQQVGLGYLRLGQPATTLSGGEAQRLKIARELVAAAKGGGRKLYLMDEPTTGLHLSDIETLARVFDRLLDAGHTVVLIEHNLDVIKLADWIIDLGPDGGLDGGRLVAMGRPEQVLTVDASHTAHALRRVLTTPVPAAAVIPPGAPAGARGRPARR